MINNRLKYPHLMSPNGGFHRAQGPCDPLQTLVRQFGRSVVIWVFNFENEIEPLEWFKHATKFLNCNPFPIYNKNPVKISVR